MKRTGWPLLVISSVAAISYAQQPIGSEFEIRNGFTDAIAVAADGNEGFVLVHKGPLQALRLSTTGQPVGTEFELHTDGTPAYPAASIAVDQDGGFVVVWDSDGSAGSDNYGWSVQARRFDSSDSPLGPQFQVNTYTTWMQLHPRVSMAPSGEFVVVWNSHGSFGSDNYRRSIQAQRFESTGLPIGGEFQVNTSSSDWEAQPDVAMGQGAAFVVVWRSSSDTVAPSEILARRYDSAGLAVGSEFRISPGTNVTVAYPKILMEADARFLVVWERGQNVFARRFDRDGNPASGAMLISDFAPNYWSPPAAAIDSTGRAVVTWAHQASPPGPVNVSDTRMAKALLPNTSGLTQFQVNAYTTSHFSPPAVAMLDDGTTLIVWEGWSPQDGNGLRGRLYTPPSSLFGDGFESGSMSAWSSFVP